MRNIELLSISTSVNLLKNSFYRCVRQSVSGRNAMLIRVPQKQFSKQDKAMKKYPGMFNKT